MPDLISHIGFGYLVGYRYKSSSWMALFLAAMILPDVVTRAVYIVFPQLYWFVKPMHTPLGVILLSVLISGFFHKKARNKVMLYICAGGMLHIFLDTLQKHMHGGYLLLFPFSWQPHEIGLIWPGETIYFTPMWIMVILFVILWKNKPGKDDHQKLLPTESTK